MTGAAIVSASTPHASTDPSVPLLDLVAQYQPIRNDILTAITRVCDSQRFIMGPEVDGLERELASMIGVEHAIGVSSGTDALLVVLMALGIGPGDEVITPTFSFFATAGCVSRLGATPVLVDVDPVTLAVNAADVARAITPKTRAIMPVHLFGLCADMDALQAVATRAGVPIIEDAAQAIGARKGDRQGGIVWPGGMLFVLSVEESRRVWRRGPGHDKRCQLRHRTAVAQEPRRGAEVLPLTHRRQLPVGRAAGRSAEGEGAASGAWTEARRANAEKYRALLTEFGLQDTVQLPVEPAGYTHIYNQFSIQAPNRDALKDYLTSRRIGTEIYYPVPFHRQECFAGIAPPDAAFPVADRAAERSLALPIYGELTSAQLRHVVTSIAAFYQTSR
jgi:dTDP-4-amino-4,6-dideoxygalactose transaminase